MPDDAALTLEEALDQLYDEVRGGAPVEEAERLAAELATLRRKALAWDTLWWADALAEIRARHLPGNPYAGPDDPPGAHAPRCTRCGTPWPCDAAQLVAMIECLEEADHA